MSPGEYNDDLAKNVWPWVRGKIQKWPADSNTDQFPLI